METLASVLLGVLFGFALIFSLSKVSNFENDDALVGVGLQCRLPPKGSDATVHPNVSEELPPMNPLPMTNEVPPSEAVTPPIGPNIPHPVQPVTTETKFVSASEQTAEKIKNFASAPAPSPPASVPATNPAPLVTVPTS